MSKQLKAYFSLTTLFTGAVARFNNYLSWLPNVVSTQNISDADLVVFTGGADVSPALYGEVPHASTTVDAERDVAEIYSYRRALELGIPMLGICRGSQFLTVMNGGKLLQDVKNHTVGEHTIFFENGFVRTTYSTHHQMMNPYDMDKDDYKLIAYAHQLNDLVYNDGVREGIQLPDGFEEPEIVYYPKSNSLAIQGHPERLNTVTRKDDIATHQELFDSFMNKNLEAWYED